MPRLRFAALLIEACIVPDARYHSWCVQHRNLIRFDALSKSGINAVLETEQTKRGCQIGIGTQLVHKFS